eukprot:7465643-Pyramimonas_sp.AAC.1
MGVQQERTGRKSARFSLSSKNGLLMFKLKRLRNSCGYMASMCARVWMLLHSFALDVRNMMF